MKIFNYRPYVFFALLILFLGTFLQAQVPLEGNFTFDKSIAPNANGLMMEMSQPANLVTQAIQNRFSSFSQAKMKDMGKGMFAYEATMYPEISANTLTYYFRVEEPTKKSTKTKVFLFLSPGYDNFLTTDKYWQEMQNAQRFLTLIPDEAQKLSLKGEIETVNEAVSSDQKELEKVVSDKEKLAKEIAKMEADLQNLKKQMTELEAAETKVKARIDEKKQSIDGLNQTLRKVDGQ